MKKWISILLCVLTLASLLYIFSNSIKSVSQVDETKDRVLKTVEAVVKTVTKKEVSLEQFGKAVLSKIGHVLEYAVFAGLFSFSVFYIQERKQKHNFYQLMLVCVFVALADEQLQSLGLGRTPKVSDVLIDFAACMVGYAVSVLIFAVWERRQRRGNRTLGA